MAQQQPATREPLSVSVSHSSTAGNSSHNTPDLDDVGRSLMMYGGSFVRAFSSSSHGLTGLGMASDVSNNSPISNATTPSPSPYHNYIGSPLSTSSLTKMTRSRMTINTPPGHVRSFTCAMGPDAARCVTPTLAELHSLTPFQPTSLPPHSPLPLPPASLLLPPSSQVRSVVDVGSSSTALFDEMFQNGFEGLEAISQLKRFVIHMRIAKTQYGMLLLAFDTHNNKMVTIKVSDIYRATQGASSYDGGKVPENVSDEARVLEFLNKANVPQSLKYRPVPEFVLVTQDARFHYIVCEFLTAGCMRTYMHQMTGGVGMSETRARKYLHQLAYAIQWLHSNKIAHCDLSLDNLCIDGNDNLRIIDFGVFVNAESRQKLSGHVRGKVNYNSPESLMSASWCPAAHDVFSFGVIMFLVLTNRFPFSVGNSMDKQFHSIESGDWMEEPMRHYFRSVLSNKAMDLLNIILKYEDKRCSLSDIIQHEWFQTH